MFPPQRRNNLASGIGKYPEVWFSLGPTISTNSTTSYMSSLCVRVRIGMDVDWNEEKRTVGHEGRGDTHSKPHCWFTTPTNYHPLSQRGHTVAYSMVIWLYCFSNSDSYIWIVFEASSLNTGDHMRLALSFVAIFVCIMLQPANLDGNSWYQGWLEAKHEFFTKVIFVL